MLIYVFAEHYPTPYKPQFDSEFAYFLRQGHQLNIFAGGKYLSTVHPRVKEYQLDQISKTIPTTLKTIPRHAFKILSNTIHSPIISASRFRQIWEGRKGIKARLVSALRALTLPHRAPDVCYIHNLATADFVDFLKTIYPGCPLYMYFHGGEVGGVRRIARDAELFSLMDAIFTNTEFSKTQAIKRGASPEKTFVIPVGFDLPDYPKTENKQYRPDGVLRTVSIGRVSEEKGLIYAVDAVGEAKARGDIELLYTIVGSGVQEKYLKDYVRSKGLESQITFAGERDKDGVVNVLVNSDVLLIPSIVTETWAETQGAVIQEAMFTGTLVVSTRTGGIPESCAPVLKRFSVDPENATQIYEAAKMICALSEDQMAEIGEEARRFAIERYDIEKTGGEILRYMCLR